MCRLRQNLCHAAKIRRASPFVRSPLGMGERSDQIEPEPDRKLCRPGQGNVGKLEPSNELAHAGRFHRGGRDGRTRVRLQPLLDPLGEARSDRPAAQRTAAGGSSPCECADAHSRSRAALRRGLPGGIRCVPGPAPSPHCYAASDSGRPTQASAISSSVEVKK